MSAAQPPTQSANSSSSPRGDKSAATAVASTSIAALIRILAQQAARDDFAAAVGAPSRDIPANGAGSPAEGSDHG